LQLTPQYLDYRFHAFLLERGKAPDVSLVVPLVTKQSDSISVGDSTATDRYTKLAARIRPSSSASLFPRFSEAYVHEAALGADCAVK
jgi:hypothetical protein